MKSSTLIVIPARLDSKRLPRKLALEIEGKTLLQLCYESIKSTTELKVVIAVDCLELGYICQTFIQSNDDVVLINDFCENGTDRVSYLLQQPEYKHIRKVIVVQGDEMLIPAGLLDKINKFLSMEKMVTVVTPIYEVDNLLNKHCVKAYIKDGYVTSLSRKYRQNDECEVFEHIGIYGYRTKSLLDLMREPSTDLQLFENIELIKALDNNYKVMVIPNEGPFLNVNVKKDLDSLVKLLGSR